jgi:hypothetical protein
MENLSYTNKLYSTCNPEEIIKLSKIVFREGHLEKIDDLIVAILPLANLIYYRYIKSFDDREYAKEDLISDAILRLYQDMTLRWDKYIYVESYYDYFSTVLRNAMIGLVHGYHNYYSVDELDPENIRIDESSSHEEEYNTIELRMVRASMRKHAIETSERILKCRRVNTNLLLNIFKIKYVEKSELDSLRSRVRVLGISTTLFNFYCEHVDYVYKLSYNYQYAMLGGKHKMINRISNIIDRFEDVTYRMLSLNYYDSIIPEIYAEFGAEITKKFVRTFSGRTIQVPDYRNFCDDLLGGVILTLANGDRSNLYQVAEEYQVPYKALARIYNKAIRYDSK